MYGWLKTSRTSKPPPQQQQQSITPRGKAPTTGSAAAQQSGPSTRANKQTRKAKCSMITSPSAPCVSCVPRAAEEAPVGRPTTRSPGRPAPAVAARRHSTHTYHLPDGRSRLRRARLAACGDARECGSSCSRPRRSQSLAAVRLARLDRRHLPAGAVSRCTFAFISLLRKATSP